MVKAYLGDLPVDRCAIGDVSTDASFLGDNKVCEPVVLPLRFHARLTAPVKPIFNIIDKGIVPIDAITVDNNDGTWDITSTKNIHAIQNTNSVATDIHIILAEDLTSVQNAWHNDSTLVSFNTEGMIHVTNCSEAWNSCSNLVNFDAGGLVVLPQVSKTWTYCDSLETFDTTPLLAVTSVVNGWRGCTKLKTINLSGLVNCTSLKLAFLDCELLESIDTTYLAKCVDIYASFKNCKKLTVFDTTPLVNVTKIDDAWGGCTGLTDFDTTPMTKVTSSDGSWEACTELVSFNTSGLSNVTNIASAWHNCPKLAVLDISNLTQVTIASRAFQNCIELVTLDIAVMTNLATMSYMLYGCTKLECITGIDSTKALAHADVVTNCPVLTAPDVATQALINATAGHKYVNPNSCGTPSAVVYDAYVIGGSLGSNITISPFIQSDGVTEEASMQGIDFLDGVERSLIIKYQAGVTDAHIDVNAPFNLAVDFSSDYVVGTNIEPMFNLADSPFKGEWVIQVVASGVEVRVKYDTVKGKLYADWS